MKSNNIHPVDHAIGHHPPRSFDHSGNPRDVHMIYRTAREKGAGGNCPRLDDASPSPLLLTGAMVGDEENCNCTGQQQQMQLPIVTQVHSLSSPMTTGNVPSSTSSDVDCCGSNEACNDGHNNCTHNNLGHSCNVGSSSGGGGGGGGGTSGCPTRSGADGGKVRRIHFCPEFLKAMENVQFIAEHTRKTEEDVDVSSIHPKSFSSPYSTEPHRYSCSFVLALTHSSSFAASYRENLGKISLHHMHTCTLNMMHHQTASR